MRSGSKGEPIAVDTHGFNGQYLALKDCTNQISSAYQ